MSKLEEFDMSTRTPLPPADALLAAGLIVACVGVAIQYLTGVPGRTPR